MSKITLSSNASGTGTFTIASPNSNTDRTINLPDSNGTILTTATAGVPVNGPAFGVLTGVGTQSLTANVATKLAFITEEFDTNSCFDSTTNYRFTPNVAGYYQLSWMWTAGTQVATIFSTLYKNGAPFKAGISVYTNSASSGMSVLVYANGTTDYFEIYASTTVTQVGSGYFNGSMVRSAT